MKQPYTYSMPESFLKDKSVPARWRVLAVINGFILNGGCFYGSNEWLMEQLGCSEPTISSAFKELEDLKEIRAERTKRTRKVYKTTRDPSSLGSETQVEPSRDPSQFIPNSVSISEKEITVANAPITEETEEEITPRKKTDPLVEKGARYWHRKCKEEYGLEPSGGLVKTMAVINRAKVTVGIQGVSIMMRNWFDVDHELETFESIQITRCLSPQQVDKFRAENI